MSHSQLSLRHRYHTRISAACAQSRLGSSATVWESKLRRPRYSPERSSPGRLCLSYVIRVSQQILRLRETCSSLQIGYNEHKSICFLLRHIGGPTRARSMTDHFSGRDPVGGRSCFVAHACTCLMISRRGNVGSIRYPAPSWQPIQRAADGQSPLVQHVRINHCRFDILMSQQFLNSSDIVSGFQQVGGRRMQASACGMYGDRTRSFSPFPSRTVMLR